MSTSRPRAHAKHSRTHEDDPRARARSETRRLAAIGRKAVAVVVSMKRRIERSFYAMGKSLAALDDPHIFHALGHPSFATLCSTELGVSPA